ncbi:MAG TPA: KpsF/GutQ family sugar-phosphate isomerase [Candidatus Eisenbacteria bacterium]|nr:KpsF/GutQ family sugar-phosphate isomerase [Candidatus Eisenbacteria bacterium]
MRRAEGDGVALSETRVEPRISEWAREVLELEGAAVIQLKSRIDRNFEAAVQALARVKGQVLTLGVGKSGLVAKKIAATLTSTGTPSTFVHPVDAVHGDLGIVSPEDAALLLSKSGESHELLDLIPAFRRRGVAVIAMTGNLESSLAQAADHVLDIGTPREACGEDIVPTSSTTAMLALGDAVAVVLLRLKGFTREDFAVLHPGGVLGRAASLRVSDLMHQGEGLPRVPEDATLRQALLEILNKRLGMTTIVDRAGHLAGILTDGDLKRILLKGGTDLGQPVKTVMIRSPKTIEADATIARAVRAMEENEGGPITSLVVLDEPGAPAGVLHLHDCLGVRQR